MTAMASRQRFEDAGALTVTAHGQHNGLVSPFHSHTHRAVCPFIHSFRISLHLIDPLGIPAPIPDNGRGFLPRIPPPCCGERDARVSPRAVPARAAPPH